MLSYLLETSITFKLLKRVLRIFYYFMLCLDAAYKNSCINTSIKRVFNKINVYFKYSFFCKVTNIKEEDPRIMNNSKAIKKIKDTYILIKGWILNYLNNSLTIASGRKIKKEFHSKPTKISSIILVSAIFSNVVLSKILQKEINLWAWLMRGLFLFLGISSFFCDIDWPTIKENSIILRLISKRKCAEFAER